MTTARTLPRRVKLRELCEALGICRMTYYRHWRAVFTVYRVNARQQRFCSLEVGEAAQHTDPAEGRAAVLRLRKALGRITSSRSCSSATSTPSSASSGSRTECRGSGRHHHQPEG